MTEKDWLSFNVMVGRAVLRITSAHAGLIERLIRRYAGFITESEAQMDVMVSINQDESPSRLLNVRPVFFNERVEIDAPGYRGMVDLEHGLSEICLPAQRIAEDTEYFLRLVSALINYHLGGLMFPTLRRLPKATSCTCFLDSPGVGKPRLPGIPPVNECV